MSRLISRNQDRPGSLFGWDPLSVLDVLTPPGGETIWSAFPEPVRVQPTEDGATITVDMPGVTPDDVELSFEVGILSITGRRGERRYSYRVELGQAFDPDRFEAALDLGVLTVRAMKRPEARPRKIEIKAAHKALGSGERQ